MITLPNGNYLVMSPGWNNAAGAVTWGNGNYGVKGVVSAFNSLVGGTEGDQVGLGSYSVRVLNTGNYLVNSPE